MTIRVEEETLTGSGIEVPVRHIYGQSVDEIMNYVMPMVRQQSKGFYSHAIPEDLEKEGKSLIDVHATGVRTTVYLEDAA